MLLHYIIMLGPETWWIHYPSASGGMQSPIDIETEETLLDAEYGRSPLEVNYHVPGPGSFKRKRQFGGIESPRGELPRPGCISWGSGIIRIEETIWGI